MNKILKILTGAMCLSGWLLLVACEGQKTKEPIKLKVCEEVDSSWIDEPSFSELNNGWVYGSGEIKEGTRQTKKLIFSDKDKSAICSEFFLKKSNICATQDSTCEYIRSIFYCKDPIKCDSTSSLEHIYGITDSYTIEVSGNNHFNKKIMVQFYPDTSPTAFSITKDEVPVFIENIWRKINEELQKDTKLTKYLMLLFDNESKLCYTQTSYLPKNEDVVIKKMCEDKIGYSVTYTYVD